MERQTRQSADIPKWSALLVEAVNKPGLIMKAYSNFHSYSLGNQLLALVQCQMRGLQPGPINTFPKWQELGRHVKRGERALMLCMPITCKRRDETTDEEANGEGTFTSFVYKARWFVLTQTEGEDLQPQVIPRVGREASVSSSRNRSDSVRQHGRQLPRLRPQAADRDQSRGPTSAQDAISRVGPRCNRPHDRSGLCRHRKDAAKPSRSRSRSGRPFVL